MRIISLTPNPNGSYNDHVSGNISAPPDGWAMWPGSLPIPTCYPFFESITAEEVTYYRETEKQQEVTKTRETGEVDEDGNPIMETYTETEIVTEQVPYTVMTVVDYVEGVIPEPVETTPEPTQLDRVEAQVTYTAMMTDTLLEE